MIALLYSISSLIFTVRVLYHLTFIYLHASQTQKASHIPNVFSIRKAAFVYLLFLLDVVLCPKREHIEAKIRFKEESSRDSEWKGLNGWTTIIWTIITQRPVGIKEGPWMLNHLGLSMLLAVICAQNRILFLYRQLISICLKITAAF